MLKETASFFILLVIVCVGFGQALYALGEQKQAHFRRMSSHHALIVFPQILRMEDRSRMSFKSSRTV